MIRRYLVAVLVGGMIAIAAIPAFIGLGHLRDAARSWGWEETSGIVVEYRSWYNGFLTERGFIVQHAEGQAFIAAPRDQQLRPGDSVAIYIDPDLPVFVEQPRTPNAFEDGNSFPRVNAVLESPLSHVVPAGLALAVASVIAIAIRALLRHERNRSV